MKTDARLAYLAAPSVETAGVWFDVAPEDAEAREARMREVEMTHQTQENLKLKHYIVSSTGKHMKEQEARAAYEVAPSAETVTDSHPDLAYLVRYDSQDDLVLAPDMRTAIELWQGYGRRHLELDDQDWPEQVVALEVGTIITSVQEEVAAREREGVEEAGMTLQQDTK